MHCKRWISSAIIAAAAVSAMPRTLPAQTTQPAESREEAAARDIREQEAILTDRSSTPIKREEAARRLVSRSSKEADDLLLRVLKDLDNRDGQIAVARALASDPTPEPAFITPLSELLGSGAVLTEAVAQALVTFKGNDAVRQTLVNYATNPTYVLDARAGIITSMGKLVDKAAAGSLIEIVNSDDNSRIRDAARNALAEMTGLPRGRDVQEWNQWWDLNKGKTEEQWSKDLLRYNASARADLNKRLTKMTEDAAQHLRESYRAAASDADKLKLLSGYLQSDSEDIRLVAVQLVGEESSQFRAVPAAVFDQIKKMVGDSASSVRQEVAVTLGTAGVGAVDALLTQLAQERDASVREKLVRALGPSHDLKAVNPLLSALNDPNFQVARSAADALGDLTSELRKPENAALAAKVAGELGRRLDELTPKQSTILLRRGLVDTMAALGHPSSRERLEHLAGPAEPEEGIRKNAPKSE